VFSVERRAFDARKALHSAFAAVKDLFKRPFSRIMAVLPRWRLRIDYRVAILGFARGRVTPLIDIVIGLHLSAIQNTQT
jgi:hypothetical protein